MVKKDIALFNNKAKRFKTVFYDNDIPFDNIYGFTINKQYKYIQNYRLRQFILSIVLKNGEVIRLYSRLVNNDKDITHEAKIIASYTKKPIFHFGFDSKEENISKKQKISFLYPYLFYIIILLYYLIDYIFKK